MNNTINIWKPVGLTPLQAVNKFKEKNPEYLREKISYAGRLDPMAEGILILLVGEENKNRDKYLALKKTYESEIIIGVSTDSFDSLGLIKKVDSIKIRQDKIINVLNKFIGKQKQIYPPYSSKAVNGKSLYWWARNNKLGEIEMPVRNIEIYLINLINMDEIKGGDLAGRIIKDIKKVDGDFRQYEIIQSWKKFTGENKNNNFMKIKIEVSCSSGTYVRRIASSLGEKLGSGAFAVSIKRTMIGDIKQKDCIII